MFRQNADASIVCPHRSQSCCPDCATLPNVREVYGVHYYLTDAEWAAVSASLSAED